MSWGGEWLFIGCGRGRLAMMSVREERVVRDFGRVVRSDWICDMRISFDDRFVYYCENRGVLKK
jgi:hypothetical protein